MVGKPEVFPQFADIATLLFVETTANRESVVSQFSVPSRFEPLLSQNRAKTR